MYKSVIVSAKRTPIGSFNGTLSSYLNVDELSITKQPASVAFFAFSFGHPPPIAKNAMSSSLYTSVTDDTPKQ